MAQLQEEVDVPWHSGEDEMHRLLHVPSDYNPTSAFLTPGAAFMLLRAPLLAFGTLDKHGRPWTSLWGGAKGFSRPAKHSMITLEALIDEKHDPVVKALLDGGEMDEEVVHARVAGKVFGGLTIDLETRTRVKLAGTVVDGEMKCVKDQSKRRRGHLQLAVKVEQSLGNCPKYLNIKRIHPALPDPVLVSDSLPLPHEATDLLAVADMFFVSSSNQGRDMDTNHRGGPPGFVRVISNKAQNVQVIWPEYSGNRLYQTLGNLANTPVAGLCFPDYRSGDVLYITGSTETLVGPDAAHYLPRSNLAVKVQVTAARFVKTGLAFRGEMGDFSPYNPPVRYLPTERNTAVGGDANEVSAMIIKKEIITPTIARFRLRLKGPAAGRRWKAGQYLAMSLEDELSMGYSHMRDDDPKSLNDDFVRTFTVSSSPGAPELNEDELEITIRKVGVATEFLFRTEPRVQLEIPLRGFGGEFIFEQKAGEVMPLIAGGIGITPLLAQLPLLTLSDLRLFWAIRLDDVNLVSDTFHRHPSLADVATILVTGAASVLSRQQESKLQQLAQAGAKVERRRMAKEDLQVLDHSSISAWYLCTGPALKKTVTDWLEGQRVVFENFDY
ncbi:MAG: hypothetical protein M1838_003441 [Thelocarpon superellum]|nr:MAG: hypothetical protein M1838_003441 [Thelocarpon superellum]